MKMHDQNNALSDIPKVLLSLFLTILTSCFDLSNKYVYRNRTTFSFYTENAQICKNNEFKKSPYRLVPYLHPENSNGRCSGTILTGNTCVTVLVIGGGVMVSFFRLSALNINSRVVAHASFSIILHSVLNCTGQKACNK